MAYSITERLLPVGTNRPGTSLSASGLVQHGTATMGATDENEYQYFSHGNRNASAHYFTDYDSITQFIPDNEEAWHAGQPANSRYLSNEMCYFSDATKFEETWKRCVWLAATKCKQYGWEPAAPHLVTHHWITDNLGGTTHTDPDAYFASHNKTWSDFLNDVRAEMGKKPVDSKPTNSSWTGQILKEGDKGSLVADLQELLNHDGFNAGNVDGIYGPHTKSAVELAQRKLQIGVDGIAGPQTYRALRDFANAHDHQHQPVDPSTGSHTSIPVKGHIKIYNVTFGAYICNEPSSTDSKNLAIAKRGQILPISGSVPGWWEVIYEGRRAYVKDDYGKLL